MRIGVDVDEVLGEFLRSMLPWLEDRYGLQYGWHDMYTYAFYEAWHVPYGEAREYIDAFLESEAFKELDVVPRSQGVIRRLAADHELFIVTSRPRYVASVTEAWLADRFGEDVFAEVLYTNAHGVGEETSKPALAEEYWLDVHIDDNDGYASRIAASGRPALLFNKPWNVDESVPRGVERFDSWKDVPALLEYIRT